MESKRFHLSTTCSISATVIVLLLLYETAECRGEVRLQRDAESAMQEMSMLFRSMFPPMLGPGQTHYFWRSKELGAATVLEPGRHRAFPDKDKGSSESAPDSLPFRLQIDFRKRGPDCMGKCISQGVLHPVQCHSLC